MTATAQNDSTSASTKRHNTNAIKLSRAIRIVGHNNGRRPGGLSSQIDSKLMNEPQMRPAYQPVTV
jgi:hypothetical protein